MDIKEVINRRSDLGTFIVHLTRDHDGMTGKERLEAMLKGGYIEARTMFGSAVRRLEKNGLVLDSQKCVCFTEAPLEYIYLFLEEIERRNCQFSPYGIAITKKLARKMGVNPVWYIDITPGHPWLMKNIWDMINSAVDEGIFEGSHIERLAPFIEQMGRGTHSGGQSGYRKEFWWEREWRHVGNFSFPRHFIILCPEEEISYFQEISIQNDISASFIDPHWGLEQVIARLAGFRREETDIF